MALDSFLYIKSNQDVIQFRKWMVDNLDYKEDENSENIFKSGVFSIVSKYDTYLDVIEETYGFLPTVTIYFRLDKFEAFDEGFANMIYTVQRIFDGIQCDEAILVGPGGETSLLYKNKQLVLQKNEWTGDNLSLFDSPYTLDGIVNM
jgi:hypothetical protein